MKIKDVYYTNDKIGIIKKFFHQILKKIYKFDEWHIAPINFRPYALSIRRELSNKENTIISKYPIVEIGCGLGEIIGSISCKNKKYAFDLSENVIRAAKIINRDVCFKKGSFKNVEIGKISCCIMVNFIHGIEQYELKEQIDSLLDKNDVEMFVLDVIRRSEKSAYKFEHQGEILFDGKYLLYKRSKGFKAEGGARRFIEYWVKAENIKLD